MVGNGGTPAKRLEKVLQVPHGSWRSIMQAFDACTKGTLPLTSRQNALLDILLQSSLRDRDTIHEDFYTSVLYILLVRVFLREVNKVRFVVPHRKNVTSTEVATQLAN